MDEFSDQNYGKTKVKVEFPEAIMINKIEVGKAGEAKRRNFFNRKATPWLPTTIVTNARD